MTINLLSSFLQILTELPFSLHFNLLLLRHQISGRSDVRLLSHSLLLDLFQFLLVILIRRLLDIPLLLLSELLVQIHSLLVYGQGLFVLFPFKLSDLPGFVLLLLDLPFVLFSQGGSQNLLLIIQLRDDFILCFPLPAKIVIVSFGFLHHGGLFLLSLIFLLFQDREVRLLIVLLSHS